MEIPEQQAFDAWPPLADSSGNVYVWTFATSTSPVVVDLASLPLLPTSLPIPIRPSKNVLGQRLRFTAVGQVVGIIFGPTIASVSGANAPVIATVNAVNGTTGKVTQGVGNCEQIPSAATTPNFREWRIPTGSPAIPPSGATGAGVFGGASPARYMAFIGAGSGQLIVSPISRNSLGFD